MEAYRYHCSGSHLLSISLLLPRPSKLPTPYILIQLLINFQRMPSVIYSRPSGPALSTYEAGAIQRILGYKFLDINLLQDALTYKGRTRSTGSPGEGVLMIILDMEAMKGYDHRKWKGESLPPRSQEHLITLKSNRIGLRRLPEASDRKQSHQPGVQRACNGWLCQRIGPVCLHLPYEGSGLWPCCH